MNLKSRLGIAFICGGITAAVITVARWNDYSFATTACASVVSLALVVVGVILVGVKSKNSGAEK